MLIALNRTILELKLLNDHSDMHDMITLNRTILELKFVIM